MIISRSSALRPSGLIPLILIVLACSSCASGVATRYYGASGQASGESPSVHLGDRGERENANGFMPESVSIKTPTQTFCAGYQFCLVDGRVYYKPSTADSSQWKLLTGTGIPHSRNPSFVAPRRIVEISADADTLLAFSDEGRMYQCYFERTTVTKPFTWIDTFGWPDKNPVVQNALVLENRSWAVGTRRRDVLWYEDIFGNQHHYGTMGIETIYFLAKDGQEIRYVDTGLPADFSHGILGPERGGFVARSLSASASTIFLIGDSGEMYTRLADFDTLGCDPMFYKYTYRREQSPYRGSDYRSNFTPWALPSEPWKLQPAIELVGRARISSLITILQTGQGNDARELRVAGLSPAGETGYYRKGIADGRWSFCPCALSIDESFFLKGQDGSGRAASRGARQEFSYTGSLWDGGMRVPGLSFSISDFPLAEGECHLTVSLKGETREIVLYPVEMWSYLQRYNPGLDGAPKYFFVTVSMPEAGQENLTEEFSAALEQLFGKRDLVLFSCRAEATSTYFQLEFGPDEPGQKTLFLTRDGIPEIDPRLARSSGFVEDPLVSRYLDPALILADADNLTVLRRTEIENALAANVEYRQLLRKEIARYNAYGNVAGLSRFSYGIFDFVTTITLLDRLDFPKFKTATQFSGDIMQSNAALYGFIAESKEWTYSKVIDLLDIRIGEYRKVLAQFDANAIRAAVSPSLRNTYPEYLRLVGFPERIDGVVHSGRNAPASVRIVQNSPLFPGLVFTVDGTKILIELTDSARLLMGRGNDPLSKTPFSCPVLFHPITFSSEIKLEGGFYGMAGKLEWDGTSLRIWRKAALRSATLMFEGRL